MRKAAGFLVCSVQSPGGSAPDDAQLTFLFERHPSGVLTLTPDRCALLATHLPNLHCLRHLLVRGAQPEMQPLPTPAEVFASVIQRKFSVIDDLSLAEELQLEPQTTIALCPNAQFVLLARRSESLSSGVGFRPLVIDVPEQDGSVQNTFHVRGGQIWRRRIEYLDGQRPTDLVTGDIRPSYVSLPFSDRWVEDTLQKVHLASWAEKTNFGFPLSESESWQFVRWLEGCMPRI